MSNIGRKTRSPIKDKLLRLPGQSVDADLTDFVDSHYLMPLMFVIAILAITWWEWFAYSQNIPRHPRALTALSATAVVSLLAYWRFRWSRAMAWRQGRDGERAVGQFLDMYMEGDAAVFHDVPTRHGNIDHVVIGSRGIYALETKTRSKPIKGDCNVVVQVDGLTVGGYKPERDPIIQAKTCAANLQGILKDSTGKQFVVRPVVLFPGWYVDDQRAKGADVWVLEPKQLPGWMKQERTSIAESDVSMAAFHLSRHIRTFER